MIVQNYNLIIIIFFFFSCAITDPDGSGPKDVIRDNGRIYIVDQTNKRWDVTHAVTEYGLKANSFQYGLGPNAIQPINNPQMLSSGDIGYPDNSSTTQIIGTTLGNDIRAYPLGVLTRHEIVNERFNDTYVSVAY